VRGFHTKSGLFFVKFPPASPSTGQTGASFQRNEYGRFRLLPRFFLLSSSFFGLLSHPTVLPFLPSLFPKKNCFFYLLTSHEGKIPPEGRPSLPPPPLFHNRARRSLYVISNFLFFFRSICTNVTCPTSGPPPFWPARSRYPLHFFSPPL